MDFDGHVKSDSQHGRAFDKAGGWAVDMAWELEFEIGRGPSKCHSAAVAISAPRPCPAQHRLWLVENVQSWRAAR